MKSVSQVIVQIKRLPSGEGLPLPNYQSQHAAGMDLHAAVAENRPVMIESGGVVMICCGFAMALPPGYEAQVRPRSGLAANQSITLINSPGTIDADYRGEVKVPLVNHGAAPFSVTRGMRVAQMIIKPVPRTKWVEVDELPPTDRGENGFGHTGL